MTMRHNTIMVSKLKVESNRKTKSAKEELEEMGEETENVITTQSKLRDTIKQATAVASNEFKGFDILDDNGNYKSTYEIMLGIADVYDEIVETDKKLGRNNANLLLESVAGKNRANIAASIFQNPKLLRDAYQSSQDANGSAMRENDKYVQSISGHLAQLTNAWQQMWANAANRDVINFFIDAAKAAVNFANAIGIIPSTLLLLVPYLEIISKARKGTGMVSSFLQWANGLNEAQKAAKEMAEAQEGLNAVKEASIAINTAEAASTEAETAANAEGTAASVSKIVANEGETASTLQLAEAEVIETGAEKGSTEADIEGAGASAIKTAANLTEAGSKAAEGVGVLGKIATSVTGKINLITGAISGLAHSALGIPLAIGSAIGIIIALKKAYDAYRESVFSDAKATTENIKAQQEATAQQIESYKQLKSQLDSGDLSEEETIAVKQQILDVQKLINEQYGTAAQGVDLINGKLEEQVDLLNSISQKEAQDQYYKNLEGYQVAKEEYGRNRTYNVKLNGSTNASLNKSINDAYAKAGLQPINAGIGTFNANVNGTASEVIDTLENAKKSLEELKKEYRDPDSINAINKQIKEVENQIGDAYEVVDKYEETALKGLELKLATNNTNGYDTYKNYQSSVSNLENAYVTGDTQKINEARKAYDEATKAKDKFLKIEDNGQFALLFNKIDTSLIDTKNRFRDTVELLKDIPQPKEQEGLFEGTDKKTIKDNAKAQSNLTKEQKKAYKAAEKLYKLNPDKVDIKATLDNNTYASGKYADALNELMNEMGWTTANADEMINALITAGIVHGDASDIAYMASDSYNVFSSSVENTIGVLNTLNTALTESAKGTGLTEQTLTELRSAFGDNLDSVLERTANGYHLNTEGAYLLRQQQEAMVNADYASAMYEQYQALDKLQEGYLKAKEAGEDTSGFVQQRQAIQDNIDKLNEQLMTFNNANSAYQTWLAKQSSEGEREMYNSVYSGYDAVKDELERGWAGEKTRSWLDLIFNDENEDWDAWTAPAEKINEKFKEVTKDIEGTGGFSIADFFTVDANGKTTSQGVWNFFEAIENKQKEVGKEFVNLEEGWFDFTQNGDYQIADMLGMDIESVHSILRAAADAGFEIHLDQPLFSLEQLEEKAYSAKEALEEATGTKLKINLDPQSEDEVDSAMQKLMQYQQALAEDTSIDPKVKTERLQQLADLMNFLTTKKREFVEDNVFEFKVVDPKELEDSKKSINDIVNRLSSYSKEAGKTNLSEQLAIDPMLLNNVDYLKEKIDELKEIRPDVDDTQLLMLNKLLEQLQNRVDLLNGTEIGGDAITVDQLMAAEKVVSDINTKLDYAAQHKDIQFNWDADEGFKEDLNIIANLPEDIKQKWGIEPDATAEDLLELAKSGQLNLEVKTSGDVPKDSQTTEKVNRYETTYKSEEVQLGVTTIGTEFAKDELQTLAGYDGQTFDTYVQAHTEQANADLDETLNKQEEVDKTDSKAKVEADNSQANGAINESSGLLSAFNGTTAWGYIHIDTGDSYSKISNISNAIRDIPSYKSTTIETIEKHTKAGANGTAHVNGTAFSRGSAYAGGNWGLPKNQTALTGELGTEIVVRDGNWFTVGDDGAEFVNLKRGDIVFNHKQAQELLENGYVTSNKGRGHLVGFANGTAYSRGSSSGAIKPSKSSSGMGGSKRSSSGGSGRSSGGGSGRSGGGNSSSKDAKETKNTLDEVEILIARIERQISNLDKTISSTYSAWAKRNNAIASNLRNVSTEIKDQEKAYTTYIKKANSVGLSASWRTKVQNGAFRIEDVKDSDLWDKINEYKQWWEKVLACKDAIVDLREKEGELYKQLFDNQQSYYEELIANTQHSIDLIDAYNDQLSEAGRLGSVTNVTQQIALERKRLVQLTDEYNSLIRLRDRAVNSGKITKGSEAWYEMQQSINEVSESIAEANTNLITFANNIRDINYDRWEKVHDAIGGVVNELKFFYDLLNEDEMFDEQGTITNQGITGFALLAQEYDTYFREVQRYQSEINEVNRQMAKAENKYDQNLVDKLKELKEAQQDASANAKKMKESMVDLTEDGIKKQIDYVKKLIEDYEDLLETQKDQTDYAKKVADQQKEINKLEKQYRAIQNDNSEEGATKRQQLRDQINEKRQDLQETQEDRRLSETKDMLGDFEEKFEEFLENKLKNIEGIVREVINATNENKNVIKDTINDVANSYGYTPSDTLKAAIDTMSNNLVSYFNGSFENPAVTSIAEGVDTIVKYFLSAQNASEQGAKNRIMADKVKESGTHIQSYTDANGKTKNGYFRDDGTLDEKYTGWAAKNGKTYRFNNGEQMSGSQFINIGGKTYHLDSDGSRATNTWRNVGGKLYYFNQNGEMLKGLQTINGKKFYFDNAGVNQKGLQTINGTKYYFDKNGMITNNWRQVGKDLYHFGADGKISTGLQTINNRKFYFDKNGVNQKGLQTINGAKYYFDGKTGAMIVNDWRQVGDGLYHFGADGKASSGWYKRKSGQWNFFDPKTKKMIKNQWIHKGTVTVKPVKGDYYLDANGFMVANGKKKTNRGWLTFDTDGKWKGYKSGTKGVSRDDLYWTNEGNKPEAIIRKSDGAILTPLSKGDSVIPNNAMKNMYQALTDPAKYLKQYTAPDIKVIQSNNNNSNNQPPVVNMQFIANGVQDANKFVNDLMNNKKLEKWVQEITLGQANGNNNYKKYSYVIR